MGEPPSGIGVVDDPNPSVEAGDDWGSAALVTGANTSGLVLRVAFSDAGFNCVVLDGESVVLGLSSCRPSLSSGVLAGMTAESEGDRGRGIALSKTWT